MHHPRYQTLKEILPNFIEFLKTMPCLYASDADNAWENWIEVPDMHCDAGLMTDEVNSVLSKWAADFIERHLDINALRENWLYSSNDGIDARCDWEEAHPDACERGEDFPEANYPSLFSMAVTCVDELIFDAHSEAYRIHLDRENELEENDDEYDDKEEEEERVETNVPHLSPDTAIASMRAISPSIEGIHNSVTFMATVLINDLYAKIFIEDSYMSDSLLDFRDTFYIPINPSELATFVEIQDSCSLIKELMNISKGRACLHKNEHGARWTDHVYHPHV